MEGNFTFAMLDSFQLVRPSPGLVEILVSAGTGNKLIHHFLNLLDLALKPVDSLHLISRAWIEEEIKYLLPCSLVVFASLCVSIVSDREVSEALGSRS